MQVDIERIEEVRNKKWNELPKDILTKAEEEFNHFCTNRNDAYNVTLYKGRMGNARCFSAERLCIPDKSGRRNYGGGSYWVISYRKIGWTMKKHLEWGFQYIDLNIVLADKFSSKKIGEETYMIPQSVDTKKEVLEIAKKLGFEISK